MRRRGFSLIRVRSRPGHRTAGVLLIGGRAIRVVLGRAGIRANKREGDGGTPRGRFRPVRLWWRADRLPRPPTGLPVRRITPRLAWCEDPEDRRYNRPFLRSASEPGDRLWREDHLYDLIVVLGYNDAPRIKGRGSAIFIHVASPGLKPTQGCIALERSHLLRLIEHASRGAEITILP